MLDIMMLAAAAASHALPPEAFSKAMCQDGRVEAVNATPSMRARNLNELPNANMVLGVLRSENGCQKPVIVRYDIGSAVKRR